MARHVNSRTRIPRVILSVLCVLVFSILGGGSQNFQADAKDAAAVRQCLVNLAAVIRVEPEAAASHVTVALPVNVLADCSVQYQAPVRIAKRVPTGSSGGHLAQPLALTNYATCRGRNLMHGIPGPGDPITILDSWQDYGYDGVNVVSRTSHTETWAQAVTNWFLRSGPYHQEYGSPPATSLRVGSDAWFDNYSLAALHEKINYVDVWYTGGCTGSFQHSGYVCGGCGVVFYIDIWYQA